MDVLAIFNPSASRVDARARETVLAALKGRCAVETASTDHPFHAAELAAAGAAEGAGLVVAIGGDGTANEAANGLAGTGTPLWCLPGGSTNVFARTMGMPPRLDAAARLLAEHARAPRVQRMTTGLVDGRHFLFMSGIGVTAEMMRRVAARPVLRARLGTGYVAVGAAVALAEAGRGRLPRLLVEAGDQAAEAATVIIQRSDPLTFFGPRPVSVCPPEALGDGTLSVAFADRAGPAAVAGIFLRLLTGDAGRVTAHPRVRSLERLGSLRISSPDGRSFGIEVDGTYVGDATSASYGVARGSLLVAGPA
jgi:diacylglycerol kinase family enzyme